MEFTSKARALRIGGSVIARTPILLPSFSSQVPLRKAGETLSSEQEAALKAYVTRLGETVAGPLLISAYDLHHGHVPQPNSDTGVFAAPLTFIDSGGYEVLCNEQLSFDQKQHAKVLAAWPEKAHAVAVNFDCPSDDLAHQIDETLDLPGPDTLGKELLLKPGGSGMEYLLAAIPKNSEKLGKLSVIGLTEKEAGSSLRDRLDTIGSLRSQLDKAGLFEMPIHVFGGLDPMRSYLYFLAGADIFDGLSWLRFGFEGGKALYLDAHASVQYPQIAINEAEWRIRRENFFKILDMQVAMRKFLVSSNLDDLHPDAVETWKRIYGAS